MSFIEKFNYNRNRITEEVAEDVSISSNLKNLVDHAYGFRKIHPDYAGYCCRLRKKSNDNLVDFKFDKNGKLSLNSTGYAINTQALVGTLSSWIGSDDGELEILYDQGLIGQATPNDAINLVHYTGFLHRSSNDSRGTRQAAHTNPLVVSGGALMTTNGAPTAKLTGSGIMQFNGGDETNGEPSGLHSDNPGVSETFLVGMVSGNGTHNAQNINGRTDHVDASANYYGHNTILGGHIFGFVEDMAIVELKDTPDNRYVFYYERGKREVGGSTSSQNVLTGTTVEYNKSKLFSSFTNLSTVGFKVNNVRSTSQLDGGVVLNTPVGFGNNTTPKYHLIGGGTFATAGGADMGKGEFQELIFSTQTLTAAQRLGVENYMSSYFNFFSLDSSALSSAEKTQLGFSTFVPTYGAQLSFEAKNSSWKGSSFYQFIAPMGLNNIALKGKLSFINNLSRTKKLLRYIENITTGVITGEQAFTGDISYVNFGSSKNGVEIGLDEGYYQNFSGTQIVDYTVVDLSDNLYKVDVSIFNNTVSPVLNNGQGFVKKVQPTEQFKQNNINSHGADIKTGNETYNKFDVIQKTGDNDFKWFCFSGANDVEVALPFPNTEVYEETWTQVNGSEEGSKVISASSTPMRTLINVQEGKFYRATKYANFTRSNGQHIMAPLSFAGKAFKATTTRTTPHRAYILNVTNTTETISRMTGPNGVNSNTVQSVTVGPGGTGQLTFTENDSHFFTGTYPETDPTKGFVMAINSEGSSSTTDNTDKMLLTPVVTSNNQRNTYAYRRRNHGQDASIINSPTTHEADFGVFHASGVSTTEIGDGAGGDGTQSLGIHNLYNYASYGNKLQDYAIVTPYSGSITVSYYTGDSWISMHTHALTGGVGLNASELTRTDFPEGIKAHRIYSRMEAGGAIFNSSSAQAGGPSIAGNEPFLAFNDSQLWKFESTCPVAIFINDTSADEEVLVGYNGIVGNSPYETGTGCHGLHNYYYVTGDTKSIGPELQGEVGFTGGMGATRTFFWEPDRSIPLTINHANRTEFFKNSYIKHVNISDNQNNLNQFNLSFTNRSEKETYSILHFLETHLGNKHFVYYHNNDSINKNRIFYCPKWSHTLVYKDSNNINATFVEIVAPTLPEL